MKGGCLLRLLPHRPQPSGVTGRGWAPLPSPRSTPLLHVCVYAPAARRVGLHLVNVHTRTCAVRAILHCALPSRSCPSVPPTPGKPWLVSTDGHAGSRFAVTAVRESSCHGWTRRSPLMARSYDEHPWMCRGRTVKETFRGLLGRRQRGRGAWGPPSRALPCPAVSSLRGGPRFSRPLRP